MNTTATLSISRTPCTDKEDTISEERACCVSNYQKDASSSYSSASPCIHYISESDTNEDEKAQLQLETPICNLTTTGTDDEKNATDILAHKGYKRHKFISKTLQGEVFSALKIKRVSPQTDEDEYVVIKTANRRLHQHGMAMTNGNSHSRLSKVKENIFKEAMIMKKFMAHNPPASCIKYHAFFWDKKEFYLVMEGAGKGLFEWTVECHERIKQKKLCAKEWTKQCKFMLKQMVECIQWMHNTMHCCHLDISLENVCLAVANQTQIKLIDFGLSELFDASTNSGFLCNQFVGKNGYKSPQIFEKREFHANKADIWSLGVTLFMMIIGAPPYQVPHVRDGAFKLIINGKVGQLLSIWKRSQYMDAHLRDLVSQMLSYDEDKRIDIDGVANHIWLQ